MHRMSQFEDPGGTGGLSASVPDATPLAAEPPVPPETSRVFHDASSRARS